MSTAGTEYLFRRHAGEVLGSLVRRFGDLDVAEDALQEALVEALVRWPREGEPRNPAAWLTTVARTKAFDRVRRAQRRPDKELAAIRSDVGSAGDLEDIAVAFADDRVADDQLALVMLCCHPALNRDAQVALTLRTVAGLTTDEIARAFMVDLPTMAQRLVRAKHKIRVAGIPFGVPQRDKLAERIDAVMQVIYLVFNAGYASSRADEFICHQLCGEAIRLGRLLNGLVPDHAEAIGLLALMLLVDARAPGRVDEHGELITLEHQDRALWRHDQIAEGEALLQRAMPMRATGRYQLEAAIAALHSGSPSSADTDWVQIDALYQALLQLVPTPVVALNAAVARSMACSPAAGLALMDEALDDGDLDGWYLLHSTRAELQHRAGDADAARAEFTRAIALAPSDTERRHLERRLASI